MNFFSRQRQTVRPDIVPLSDTELGAALPSTLAFQEVEDRIAALARAGALDEGNKRVLDGLIETWREQHQDLLTAFHLDLAASRDKRIRELTANVEVARKRLVRAEDRLQKLQTSPVLDGRQDDEPVQLAGHGTQQVAEQATEAAA